MRIAIIMTVYFIIYFSGWAILGYMWKKAKVEKERESENGDKKR